jgi:dolichol-phosphate mannosyltransferase
MDCDLQDQPEEIPSLFEKAQEGFEQVVALRHNRQDSLFKRVISRLFYNVMAFLTETKLDSRIGNYGIYSRKVIDAVLSLGDKTRTFSILVRWVGFSRSELMVEHASRPHGASAYSIRKLYSLGLQTILGSSEKPLRLTINFGFGVSIASLLLALSLVVRRLAFGVQAVGWTSTVVLLSFMFGVVISCIGIVGLYVGRIFEQTKDRPVFIIDSTTSSFPGSRGG